MKIIKVIFCLFLIIVVQVSTLVPAVFAQEATASSDIQPEASQAEPSPTLTPPSPTPTSPSPSPSPAPISLDQVQASNLENLSQVLPKESISSSAKVKLFSKVRKLFKKNFRANESVSVVIDNAKKDQTEIEVFDSDGRKIEPDIQVISESDPVVYKIYPGLNFKPGKYRLSVKDAEGELTDQDFTWGVLAINPNKSIYFPNETAKLSIAVLDDGGMMVCDAKVQLRIKNLELSIDDLLSTENGGIKINPECLIKDFVEKADYEGQYQLQGIGNYELTLTANTKNGTHEIKDAIEVRDKLSFDIERSSSTRLFPPISYPMVAEIVAQEDFTGTIKETVPGNMVIEKLEGVEEFNEIKVENTEPSDNEKIEAPISGLVPPFDRAHPISLRFGQNVDDPIMGKKYTDFGVIGHDGVDFDVPEGTAVLAVDDGEVVKATDLSGDYGITVVIEHSWGKSYYGHLSQITTMLGKKIEKGHPIGMSGSTGLATGPHLHFGIKPNSSDPNNGYFGKVNPLPYLSLKEGEQDILGETAGSVPNYEYLKASEHSTQVISWNVSLKKGEKVKLGYKFKVPNISPQFYLIGPLKFVDQQGGVVFQEARSWQLAVDADGSGVNTVDPNYGVVSDPDRIYTFTYGPSELLDSGGMTITVPSGWSAPQGTAGTAGYTTATGTGNATVGNVLNNADVEDPSTPAGIWNEVDVDMCGNATSTAAGDIVVNTTTLKEGTGSIECLDSNSQDNNDSWGFIYDANQNWETFCNAGDCQQIGYWIRAAANTEAFNFAVSSTTDVQAGVITGASCTGNIATANTWEYNRCDISTATLTTVRSFGFVCTSATCNPFEQGSVFVDEFLIGPGVPTFSGAGPWDITVRFLDLLATDTVTVTYGSGGGTSGVDNSATQGTHTFTTKSKIDAGGTFTNIAIHPTITLVGSMADLMRHGNWFNSSGVEQYFVF